MGVCDQIEQSSFPIIIGLIGGENPPISSYSKSRIMWNATFAYHDIDAEYIPLDVGDNLAEVVDFLLKNDRVLGFNISNPHKEATMQQPLIEADAAAQVVGGVNTVHKVGSAVYGHSTDGYGALRSIEEKIGRSMEPKSKVVVLGAGGTGCAIAVACQEAGAEVYVINRTYSKAQALAMRADANGKFIFAMPLYGIHGSIDDYDPVVKESMKNARYVINTIDREKITGEAMFSPDNLRGRKKVCMDAVYGHHSFFLAHAETVGHETVAGEWMLLHQAVKAFEYVFQDAVKEKGITTSEIEKPMRMALQSGLSIDASYEETKALVQ